MTHPLRRLSRVSLLSLADALASERLGEPYAAHALRQFVPGDAVEAVAISLAALASDGMAGKHIATMLRLLTEERLATQEQVDRVSAVWSPPEFDHIDARDTAAVVRGLFNEATSAVDIVTFALDEGEKAAAIFGDLAVRMDAEAGLMVRIFANIHRKYQDDASSAELIRRFRSGFSANTWPGARLPEVLYDPRSLAEDGEKRAVLHAKLVIVDQREDAAHFS